MGVPGYLVASSVVAILAQRLVRTICPKCRARHIPGEAAIKEAGLTPEQIEGATFMRGKGCNSCQKIRVSRPSRHLRDVDRGFQGSRDDFR